MKILYIITLLFILSLVLLYAKFFCTKIRKTENLTHSDTMFYLGLLILTCTIVKTVSSWYYYEAGDMGAFISWMNGLQNDGFAGFYTKHGLAYPPLHIFVVYLLGILCKVLHIANYSALQILIIKSPAIICDILTGVLIYKIGKKYSSDKIGLAACTIYYLNPAAFMISSIWGQMDSIYTFFIVLMCYLICERKLKASYFAFAAAILFKYQGIIFTPVVICGIIDQVFINSFSIKKFITNLLTGIGAICAMILCHIPFFTGANVSDSVGSSYGSALSSYAFASVNAYNFWTMCGLNWHTQEDKFLSLTYNTWGTIAIVLLVIFTLVMSLLMKNNDKKYMILAAFIISTMFLFSVRMHERYLFPVIPLVLAAFVIAPHIETYITYAGFTLANLLNCVHVLFYYNPRNYNPKAPALIGISAATLIIWVILVWDIIVRYIIADKKNKSIS